MGNRLPKACFSASCSLKTLNKALRCIYERGCIDVTTVLLPQDDEREAPLELHDCVEDEAQEDLVHLNPEKQNNACGGGPRIDENGLLLQDKAEDESDSDAYYQDESDEDYEAHDAQP